MPVKKEIKLRGNTKVSPEQIKDDIQYLLEFGLFNSLQIPDYDLLVELIKRMSFPDELSGQELNLLCSIDSQTKRLEALLHRVRFTFFPKLRLKSSIPPYLLIEPTSVCNMRCPMCFQIDKSFTTNEYMGFMDIKLFKKTIDMAVNCGVQALTLASRGEPTLHPGLTEMLEYCAGKFIELKINTNASRLDAQLAQVVLSSNVTHVVFSVDSHLKCEYEQIRRGGVFEDVLHNIQYFSELRESRPDQFMSTRVSGVRFLKSQDEAEFKRFWENYVDDAMLSNAEERWDTYNNPISPHIGRCFYPLERLYVWHDGTLNPCDVDYKSYLSPGNIDDFETLTDAWQSDGLKALRTCHETGDRAEFDPCCRCGVSHCE